MNSMTNEVLILQLVLLSIAAIPVILYWYVDKFSAVFIVLAATIVSVFAWLNISEFLQYLHQTLSIAKDAISYIHKVEPKLVTTWDVVVSWVSLLFGVITSWVLSIAILFQGNNKPLRGAVLLSIPEIKNKIILKRGIKPFNIGGVPIPYELETRPVISAGEPGVGKTQMLKANVAVARERGIKVFCVDAGGDVMRHFWKKGDYILDPTDDRSVDLSIYSEIRNEHDCLTLAKSGIPDGKGESASWNTSAQELYAEILRCTWKNNLRQNKHLNHYISTATTSELKELIKGTPSAKLFEPGSEKMLSNIQAIIALYLSYIQFLNPEAGEDSFSIRSYVENEDDKGWLWGLYNESSSDSLLSLRRACIDTFIRTALGLSEDYDRRILLVIDELPSNGELKILLKAAARGRKHGLMIMTAYQSLSQLNSIYGIEGTKSILSCAGHTLILRTPDADTAGYLSRSIGDAEKKREQVNLDGNMNVASRQQVIETKPVVLPSEIMNLPDLKGYLKIAGIGWTKVSIPVISQRLSETTMSHIPSERRFSVDITPLSDNQLDEV